MFSGSVSLKNEKSLWMENLVQLARSVFIDRAAVFTTYTPSPTHHLRVNGRRTAIDVSRGFASNYSSLTKRDGFYIKHAVYVHRDALDFWTILQPCCFP